MIGDLKAEPNVQWCSLEERLAKEATIPVDEVQPMADFMRRCLSLDPWAKASIWGLPTTPWLRAAN